MERESLRQMYPRRYEVPFFILVSSIFLWFGLSLPLVHVEKMVFWKSSYSVTTGVLSLWEQGEYFLATILFFFSFVFPILKLLSLALIWGVGLTKKQREKLLHWLGILGKWSMLDVFVVAILIVLVKMGPLAQISPRQGVYYFCLAIFFSMLTTMYVERLATARRR